MLLLTFAADEAGATYVESLSEFLGQCDVVSVHIPLSDATRHFLSTKEFAMFKKGSRVVNTARGPVIDEEALVAALKSGQLSGAGLDVFEQEPKVHPWLLEADNVILQPHTGVCQFQHKGCDSVLTYSRSSEQH